MADLSRSSRNFAETSSKVGGKMYMQRKPAGAILAGGKSTRMGCLKEGVLLSDGRAMIEHVAQALRPLCEVLVVSGSCRGYEWNKLPVDVHIDDRHMDIGPLGGIASLLESGIASRYLIVSCDQPLLTDDVLQELLDESAENEAVFLRTEEGEELDPFPGIFPVSWLPLIHQAIGAGAYSVRRLIRECEFTWKEVPNAWTRSVISINSPVEARKAGLKIIGALPDAAK
jgi:molybdopterin-guanine dinucleotide biosynthesis protein A